MKRVILIVIICFAVISGCSTLKKSDTGLKKSPCAAVDRHIAVV